MQTVRSADHTTIAFEQSGLGPALILVGGAFSDRSSGKAVATTLASSFTVYAYDRRGRGASGDVPTYSIESEVEDLRAVAVAAGGSPYVYGHSSGAALALEAAASGVDMSKLAVYEPPYITDSRQPEDFADQLRALVASGQRAEAAELFIRNTGAPAEVVTMIKSGPSWAGMQAIAHTLPYDITLCDHGSATKDWLGNISVPTLALAGGSSPQWASEAARDVAAAVPDAVHRVVARQDHNPSYDVILPLLKEFFA